MNGGTALRRSRFGPRAIRCSLVLMCVLTLVLLGSLARPKVASAHPAYGCNVFNVHNGPVYAFEGNNIYNCNYFNTWMQWCAPTTKPYTIVNADSWQTQQPWPGGRRYAESGRRGQVGIPDDCSWHYMTTSDVMLSDPQWACAWYDWVSYGVANDFVCDFIQ
jgi:hypothetical protein